MYHVIQAAPPGVPNADLWVAPNVFTAEVHALAARGYHGVTLSQVWDYWRRGVRLPAKPIVLTFDDGYFSQYSNAAATLKAAGWPGVLFLKTGSLATAGGLNRTEVKRMLAAGWEVGAHTITHADLSAVGAAQLHREVAGSRAIIHRDFGVPVRWFAYPAGRYDDAAIAEVRRDGFDGAVTVEPGIAKPSMNRFALPRVRVHATDTPQSLLARL